jgi:8-oxo-dGTP pyrophosphatase MutT (NUDIX family)
MATQGPETAATVHRHGVVAVVVREDRFLVIRRAPGIAAPGKYCFPGGGIEPGEVEEVALRRELWEELAVEVQPLRCVWRSVTPWGVALAWWLADLPDGAQIIPNPAEVESVSWLAREEMLAMTELLESNRLFLDAIAAGQIVVD